MFDDRDLISGIQLAALRPALRSPTVYTQRLVEHLDFLPQGGQRWRRDLQILIPEIEGVSREEDHWFIVSLGQFRRRRLPDFTVTDCAGRALNLLTRVQHGHCLADFTIDQYLTDPERDRVQEAAQKEPGGMVGKTYSDVYMPTFEMFTSVRKDLAPVAEGSMATLLHLLGTEVNLANRRAALFMQDMTDVAKVTQYLCWVRGRPGWAVKLTAAYSMPDPTRLAGPDPTDGSELARLSRLRAGARKWRSEQYARFGIGPVHYSFPTPANDHAASYYFSIEPPPESSIPYLDWGLENTIEGDGEEWICAHNSVHLHNGSGLLIRGEEPKPRVKIPESKIHAFLRLDPADHKQVVFAAMLSLIFVWLAEAGRLSSQVDGAAASWLAFTPAVLLAYVAQQRRHYFAGATRRVRTIVWGYLLLNIVFAVSITFDIASSGSFADRHGFSDDFVSILLAGTSIVMLWIFTFVGRPYEWAVLQGFRLVRWRNRWKYLGPKSPESTVHSYVRVSRWYGNFVALLIFASLCAMAVVLLTGNGPNPSPEPSSGVGSKPNEPSLAAKGSP